MVSNVAINFRDQTLVRKAGMSALKKELGTVGAAYFIRQFSTGQGDYTVEREKLLEGITFDEIVKNVRELDKQYG
jgi:hypothetical protein